MEVERFPDRPRRKTTLVINDICTCLTFNIMQGFACTGKSFATDSGVLQTGDIKITGFMCGSVEFWLSRSRGKFLTSITFTDFLCGLSQCLFTFCTFTAWRKYFVLSRTFSLWNLLIYSCCISDWGNFRNTLSRPIALWLCSLWDWDSPFNAVKNQDQTKFGGWRLSVQSHKG